jgi:hypothetical protein
MRCLEGPLRSVTPDRRRLATVRVVTASAELVLRPAAISLPPPAAISLPPPAGSGQFGLRWRRTRQRRVAQGTHAIPDRARLVTTFEA